MKLLVIEDQATLAQYLKKGLTESGFVVDLESNGEYGLAMALSNFYDLVILDGLLPGLDGWSIVKKLREARCEVPVLFLSARDELSDRIKGLDNGADSYLAKPFAFSELLAQIRSLLRRKNPKITEPFKVRDLLVDVNQHKAFRSGKKLDLTPKEFALLSLLVRRQGEILSRTLIAELVWDMNFDSDTNVVDVHIRRLRSKVDDPFSEKLIQTVRGLGYTIESDDSMREQIPFFSPEIKNDEISKIT